MIQTGKLIASLPLVLLLNAESLSDEIGQTTGQPVPESGLHVQAGISGGGLVTPKSTMPIGAGDTILNPGNGLSGEMPGSLIVEENSSQGLQIERLNASIETGIGTLRVGRDWASFNELLLTADEPGPEQDDRHVVDQIRWLTPNGFSIALESSPKSSFGSAESRNLDHQADDSTSVVLSWQRVQDGRPGDYRISAMGTRLNLSQGGQGFDGDNLAGWGLNLQGNWKIGDLVTALSVTYGQGIDSYILRRDGRDLYVMPGSGGERSSSYSVRPSLYYALSDRSKFHIVLGHHGQSFENDSQQGGKTLDTIHLEYTWSPWPRTELGVKLSQENAEGTTDDQDNTRILLKGSARF
ncbi:MAG: hypothetical protein F4Z15_01735 [Gammaproteobacteria bacterium]|nr:hypothetical protein [Gammaproteobacteria bacterium]MYD76010.1 hypothetical protein [Gammaproteobacteria bacterium]MYJ52218.1 hypothetical protein [Gammaproteobacteria bacterium]